MSGSKRTVQTAYLGFGLILAGCGGTQTGDMTGYNSGSRSLDSNMVSSANSFGAATLGSKLLPLAAGKTAFVTGINISSFGGATDREFGKNPFSPESEVSYNSKQVGTTLSDLSGIGGNVVRIRLFQKFNGLKVDSAGMVSGLDETFLKNLSDLLDKAENSKVQVYVSLGDPWSESQSVKNPVSDINARNNYLKKAITPLAGKLKGRPSVFAIDVFNEIEGEVAGKEGNLSDKGVNWDQARGFLKATVDVIKSVDPQRLVSAGSGKHGWSNVRSGKFAKLGLDFYDVHVFDDKGVLPPIKDLKVDRPVLIGACGQESKKSDPELQAKADLGFLDSAQKQGYAGAILSEVGNGIDNPLNLLDKDGKHKPVLVQFQTFVTTLGQGLPPTLTPTKS